MNINISDLNILPKNLILKNSLVPKGHRKLSMGYTILLFTYVTHTSDIQYLLEINL